MTQRFRKRIFLHRRLGISAQEISNPPAASLRNQGDWHNIELQVVQGVNMHKKSQWMVLLVQQVVFHARPKETEVALGHIFNSSVFD